MAEIENKNIIISQPRGAAKEIPKTDFFLLVYTRFWWLVRDNPKRRYSIRV